MATHNLPFPLTDSRSYIAAHSTRIPNVALYSQDDLQYAQDASYKHPEYRDYVSQARQDGTPSQGGLGGMGVQVVGSYAGPSVPRHSHYSSSINNEQYIPIAGSSHYDAVPSHVPRQSERYPALSPSTSPLSPSTDPEQHLPSTSRAPPASQPFPSSQNATPSKRKDKPRLALAPDQPLTSQGKPRTRVYVACVQCRSRKIRCDGAKPICHNCSRRAGATSTSPPECNYDTAPKRRGPDRNPGARQRFNATDVETSEGGKVRRRRRRPTESSPDKGLEDVKSPPKMGAADEPDQRAIHMDPIAGVDVAAQSQIPTKPTRLTVLIDDVEAYSDPSGSTSYSLGSSSGSSHIVSPLHFPSPSHHDDRISRQEASELRSQQDLAHFSQSPLHYRPSDSALTYVGYVPSSIVAGGAEQYYDYDQSNEEKTEIGPEPSLRFTRDTWWDALLILYSGRSHGPPPDSTALTPALRESTMKQVLTDLRQLFRASNYWFSFLNASRFFTRLLDPQQRHVVQPSLVLGALAVSVFIHSSEREGGSKGRAWAMRLRDEAQSALEASVSTRSIDVSLVHAAWLIAFFEICAHPNHSSLRVHSTFSTLDSLIRTLSLTQVDKDDARVTAFSSQLVPGVADSPHTQQHFHQWDTPTSQASGPCSCTSHTLGHNNPMAQQVTPLWLTTPAWGANWSEAEISKEECRRVVWSSMTLSAGHSSYTFASGGFSQMDLFVNDPANYAVFFPGEAIMSRTGHPKDSIWALYMRAMLLWHSCIRMRRGQTLNPGDKARFAVNAWLEVDRIEEGLNRHTCNIERAYLFQGREYLFNCRMCISHEFSRYIPQATANANLLFHRKKAEEWLTHQAWVAKTVVNGLQTVTGQPNVSIGKRPFFVFWFMSQIRRALTLWSCDQSLLVALDVSKALMGPIEFLMSLWPCGEQRKYYHELIDILTSACNTAGISPPQIYSPVALSRPIPR